MNLLSWRSASTETDGGISRAKLSKACENDWKETFVTSTSRVEKRGGNRQTIAKDSNDKEIIAIQSRAHCTHDKIADWLSSCTENKKLLLCSEELSECELYVLSKSSEMSKATSIWCKRRVAKDVLCENSLAIMKSSWIVAGGHGRTSTRLSQEMTNVSVPNMPRRTLLSLWVWSSFTTSVSLMAALCSIIEDPSRLSESIHQLSDEVQRLQIHEEVHWTEERDGRWIRFREEIENAISQLPLRQQNTVKRQSKRRVVVAKWLKDAKWRKGSKKKQVMAASTLNTNEQLEELVFGYMRHTEMADAPMKDGTNVFDINETVRKVAGLDVHEATARPIAMELPASNPRIQKRKEKRCANAAKPKPVQVQDLTADEVKRRTGSLSNKNWKGQQGFHEIPFLGFVGFRMQKWTLCFGQRSYGLRMGHLQKIRSFVIQSGMSGTQMSKSVCGKIQSLSCLNLQIQSYSGKLVFMLPCKCG